MPGPPGQGNGGGGGGPGGMPLSGPPKPQQEDRRSFPSHGGPQNQSGQDMRSGPDIPGSFFPPSILQQSCMFFERVVIA